MKRLEEFLDYLVSLDLLERVPTKPVQKLEDMEGLLEPDALAEAAANFLGIHLVRDFPDVPNFDWDTFTHMLRVHRVYPLALIDEKLKLAMADPWNEAAIEDFRLFGCWDVERAVVSKTLLSSVLSEPPEPEPARILSEFSAEQDDPVVLGLEHWLDDPAGRQVCLMLVQAIWRKAEAIVLKPVTEGLQVEFVNFDGDAVTVCLIPHSLSVAVMEYVEKLGQDCRGNRPQRVRIHFELDDGRVFNLRLSRWPDRTHLQFFTTGLSYPNFERMGLTSEQEQLWSRLLEGTGLLLIAGPPRSGLSWTWLSSLFQVRRIPRTLATLEDPVERWLPDPEVRRVNLRRHAVSFAEGLESLLQDDPPQAIFLSELVEAACLRSCLEVADRHLIVAMVEADSSQQALWSLSRTPLSARLWSRLRGLCSQRLYPCLCEGCRRPKSPPAALRAELASAHEAPGCPMCGEGTRGVCGVFEFADALPEGWWECPDPSSLREKLRGAGLRSLRSDWLGKVAQARIPAKNPPPH